MRIKRQSGIALVTTMIVMLLVLSLVLGFTWLTMTDQQLGGTNARVKEAFYGAEAGMEKLTADLGQLFAVNSAPTGAQVDSLAAPGKVPAVPNIRYLTPDGTNGYQIDYPRNNNGNPLSQNHTILSGSYQGMWGLITPFTLTITARHLAAGGGAEVKLQRQVQTVGIPVFQFGMFCGTDCSFFAGPDFDFGGRMHTNGNLFLASGSTLTFRDRVTAAGEVVREELSNGWPTNSGYTGTVNIPTAPGNSRALGMNEGSVTGPLGAWRPTQNWPTISSGYYNGYITNRLTGARKLDLSITLGGGGQPVDLIRRPVQGEDTSAPGVLAQRFYDEASLRILLSDNASDITNLPCLDASKAPVNLATLTPAQTGGATGVPIAVSGAATEAVNYDASNGYWTIGGTPLITGFLKVEVQTAYAVPPTPCGTWKDVTAEILGFGIAGRNLNRTAYGTAPPGLPPLPGQRVAVSTCGDPSSNAIIRLERVRDNPSLAVNDCGLQPGGTPSTQGTDYWPNALFDTREGTFRDVCPSGNCASTQPMLNGVMNYVELDINNLGRWLTGVIGTGGPQAKDPSNSTYNFVVYFSDRRGNYTPAAVAGGWPPPSPSGRETGEYGFQDFINPDSQFGCPNGTLDAGETLDQDENATQTVGGAPQSYGQSSSPPATLPALLAGAAIMPNPNCAGPANPWPGSYANNGMEARENIPRFFRRALKVVNGNTINLGMCPNGNPCGLTIASENPVYVQGDFNAAPGGNFGGAHAATAIIADALTFLSNSWNDVNSFTSPYRLDLRTASTTTYRVAVIAGKGISFPQPTGYGTSRDFGTDGGVHNFLRYLENWGGQTLFYRGSIASLYYNRQATGIFKCCATVYSPPTRAYNFDTDFLQPALLPPRTPMFRDVNTVGFTQMILPNQ